MHAMYNEENLAYHFNRIFRFPQFLYNVKYTWISASETTRSMSNDSFYKMLALLITFVLRNIKLRK